ncbi:glycoside hydrolase family 76 protein [Kutzneria albida]|uniref:glycoside hydrolase family 76 protein n=1 Tax=Kutzneria albida TaxID=43357 RepID=UPI00130E9D69|nr:glycoside hydrolase family 76 protein [Kutzneria albida]
MVSRLALIFCCVVAVVASTTATTGAAPDRGPLRSWISAGAAALDAWYVPKTGVYETTNWWNAANELQAQLVSSKLLGDTRGMEHAATTYDAKIDTSFQNDFYDDEGWWALTWVQAYDITHEHRYLVLAESLFTDIASGWDRTCGGGIWWSKSRDYKNAIPNELFISLAAKLALRTQGAASANYRTWAELDWNWFHSSGMINDRNLVNDGLSSNCRNNAGTIWSYNQGVIVDGLTDLYKLTGQHDYIDSATRIAKSAMSSLTDKSGILHEPCEPMCNVDQTQFKGIFVRSLVSLNQIAPSSDYLQFATRNANAIWYANSNLHHQFGLRWNGSVDTVDASRQGSALDCLNSAMRLGSKLDG